MIVNEINSLNHATFKYEMINSTTGVSYGSGNFADITNGSSITFSNKEEKLALNTIYEFTLYLWIDGTIGNNPLSMAGEQIDFDMNCTMFDEQGGSSGGTNLIDFIKNQYTRGNPTLITQDVTNHSYYYSYQDTDKTWGLMNDGLKIDTSLDATTTGLATTVTSTAGAIESTSVQVSICEVVSVLISLDWKGLIRSPSGTSVLPMFLRVRRRTSPFSYTADCKKSSVEKFADAITPT
jgi:hypothetical protein